MRIGLCAWSFSGVHGSAGTGLDPHVPQNLARIALEHGLKLIECSAEALRVSDPQELDRLVQYLSDNNLEIILDTGGNLAEDATPVHDALETAHRVGSPVVCTTISHVIEGDRTAYGLVDWTRYLQSLVEPLKRLMSVAEARDIAVGIENNQDICSWELCWLCDQVGSPLLGSTMDVGNAYAVAETPRGFASRVMPYLKHVHIKDYVAHPTASGYRLTRCAIGSGAVDWSEVLGMISAGAPEVRACIELGATTTMHIRLLEEDYWSTYPPRPPEETTAAIALLQRAAKPADEDWRTPHERRESAAVQIAYEMAGFEESVGYLKDQGMITG